MSRRKDSSRGMHSVREEIVTHIVKIFQCRTVTYIPVVHCSGYTHSYINTSSPLQWVHTQLHKYQ